MLTYDNLILETQRELPNFKTKYTQLIEEDEIDTDSGIHIVFSYAFTPMLLEALKNKDEKIIREMFSFLEKMASSKDNRIIEVCDQAVLEKLHDDIEADMLYKYMGTNTTEGYEALKQYMG